MSTLTQFLPPGDSFVGEVVAGPAAIWGGNPTFSGKEYLRTGLIKTYDSNYSGLLAALPTACVANGQAVFSNNDWLMGGYGDSGAYSSSISGANIFELGGNKHVIYYASVGGYRTSTLYAVRYGSSFASSPTSTFDIRADGNYGGGINQALLFKNAIYVSCFLPGSYSASYAVVFRSTGGAYSASFNGGYIDSVFLAASPNRLVAINYTYMATNNNNSIGYTNDGVNWSYAAPNIDLRYPQRFCWSNAGSCFIIVSNSGNIFTSPDGVTWTQQTKPANMPTSVGGYSNVPYCINTPTATYIMIGAPNTSSTYMLKTTNGTSFTLVDLADSAPLIGLFTGTTSAIPYLLYDGTRMILSYGALQAYSSDEGVTWNIDTVRYQNVNTAWNAYNFPILYSNGIYQNWYIRTSAGSYTQASIVDFTGRSFGATPQFVGATAAQTFATGSSLSTYFRIK